MVEVAKNVHDHLQHSDCSLFHLSKRSPRAGAWIHYNPFLAQSGTLESFSDSRCAHRVDEMFPSIKLTDFDRAGRSEAARLAFFIGGVPFIDNRVTKEKSAALEPSSPIRQVPQLDVDGQRITQPQAILRFAGRLGGLYPVTSPFTSLKVDEIIHGLGEMHAKVAPYLDEADAINKTAMREELATVTLPHYASKLEARLGAMLEIPAFQSDTILLHHVAIFEWVESVRTGQMGDIPVTLLDEFKLINSIHDKVAAHPKVQEWCKLPHNPSPKLKLSYFPAVGRGEPIRLALFIAGIEFEDHHVPFNQWLTIKPTTPFGNVPVLTVDGNETAQSLAILRYVGSITGLYPTAAPLLAMRVDELFAAIDELYNAPIYTAIYRASDPATKEELGRIVAGSLFISTLEFLNSRVAEWGGPHAIGSTFTVADLAIYVLINILGSGRIPGTPTAIAEPYEHLKRVQQLVHEHPKVIEWNAAKEQVGGSWKGGKTW